MKEILWRVPLSVTLQNGMSRRFTGPYEALDFLEYEWPCHGKRYHRAVRDCRAALSGILSTEVARASFTTPAPRHPWRAATGTPAVRPSCRGIPPRHRNTDRCQVRLHSRERRAQNFPRVLTEIIGTAISYR